MPFVINSTFFVLNSPGARLRFQIIICTSFFFICTFLIIYYNVYRRRHRQRRPTSLPHLPRPGVSVGPFHLSSPFCAARLQNGRDGFYASGNKRGTARARNQCPPPPPPPLIAVPNSRRRVQ